MIESDSVDLSRCVNALKGTEPDGVELVVVFADEEEELLVVPTPELSAFDGALSTPEDGVKAAGAVVAFDPAEEEPEAAKDVEAPGPEPPEDALACM